MTNLRDLNKVQGTNQPIWDFVAEYDDAAAGPSRDRKGEHPYQHDPWGPPPPFEDRHREDGTPTPAAEQEDDDPPVMVPGDSDDEPSRRQRRQQRREDRRERLGLRSRSPHGHGGPHAHHPGPPGPHGHRDEHGPHGPRGHHSRGGRGGRGRGRFPFGGPTFGPGTLPFGGRGLDLPGLANWVQSTFLSPEGRQHAYPGTQASGAQRNVNAEGDFTPAIDIFSTDAAFVVHASLPGALKQDIAVNWKAETSTLHIRGVVHRPGDEKFLKTLEVGERQVGAFERKVVLGTASDPVKIDEEGIFAKLDDGVLRVTVPKLRGDDEFVAVKRVVVE